MSAVVLASWTLAVVLVPHTALEANTRATRTALTAPQQAPSPAPPTGGPSTVPVDASSGSASADPSAGPGTPAPGTTAATAAGTSEQLRPDETVRGRAPAATPVPVPPTGPVNCTNAMLRVTAEIDRPQHRVGDHPVLRLVITNAGGQPCVRDLDSARQEIVVWSGDGATRLWSSNDCVNAHSNDLRTLLPGQPVAFSVTWAGRTSSPGCAKPRTVVPAGAYRLLTRLDDIISPPTPFILS